MVRLISKITDRFTRLPADIKRWKRVPETLYEVDVDFNVLYNLAQSRTQMTGTDNFLRRQRHYTLTNLLQQTDLTAGNIAECGSWRGLSAYQLATRCKKAGFDRRFYLFDSFEGLSDFHHDDLPAGGIDEAEQDRRKKQFACSQEMVQRNLQEFDFMTYKKGWVPDRFPEVSGEVFCFVHIDLDLYQPIKDAAGFFYDRLVKNGIMVFDDYGSLSFPGARKAVDEFRAGKDVFFLSLPSEQAFLIKR